MSDATTFQPADVRSLLQEWGRRANASSDAHYDAARHFSQLNYWIGIPAVVLSSLVGSAVFASLEKQVATGYRIGIGFLSVAAAVLSGVQTFLRYAERAEKHRLVGARYGFFVREVEGLLALAPADLAQKGSALDDVRAAQDKLAEEAPGLPHRIWKAARLRYYPHGQEHR
jgi:hypothetical protein